MPNNIKEKINANFIAVLVQEMRATKYIGINMAIERWNKTEIKAIVKLAIEVTKLILLSLKTNNKAIINNITAKNTLTVMRELNITLYENKIVIIKCK